MKNAYIEPQQEAGSVYRHTPAMKGNSSTNAEHYHQLNHLFEIVIYILIHINNKVDLVMAIKTHQVADVNDAGDFASRWGWLPGCADRVIDRDGNSCFLLADGATNEGVAGGH